MARVTRSSLPPAQSPAGAGSARPRKVAGGRGIPVARRRLWRRRLALALATIVSTTGCYTHVPYGGPAATPPGSVLVLDLNDRGRSALGDSIGPAAQRIEGRLQAASDSAFNMSVMSVQYFGGQANQWSGEPLRIHVDHVGRAQERRFSRLRTWGLAGGAVAAVLILALTTDLFTGGGIAPGDDGGPPSDQ